MKKGGWVNGHRVILVTKETVRRWLRTHHCVLVCDACGKVLDLGQWYASKPYGTTDRYHDNQHVDCLTPHARTSQSDITAIRQYVAAQERHG